MNVGSTAMLCVTLELVVSCLSREPCCADDSEEILKKAGHVARDELVSFGTCFGKFTKTSKFRLHITALDFLAPYAKVHDVTSSSVWK